jgi:hypothetical protein
LIREFDSKFVPEKYFNQSMSWEVRLKKLTSKLNRTPPIGALNATETPNAHAADIISRYFTSIPINPFQSIELSKSE